LAHVMSGSERGTRHEHPGGPAGHARDLYLYARRVRADIEGLLASLAALEQGGPDPHTKLGPELDRNLELVQQATNHCDDVFVRHFRVGGDGPRAALILAQTLPEKDLVADAVMNTLTHLIRIGRGETGYAEAIKAGLEQSGATVPQFEAEDELSGVVSDVMTGEAAVLVDGVPGALVFDVKKWPGRDVEEPMAETVTRGPRDGFVEQALTNIGLIRQRMPVPDLKVRLLRIGRRSQTPVAVMYFQGIADPDVVGEIQRRLAMIDTDIIPADGYIEQFIEDRPLSPFPQLQVTERPDNVVMGLAQGRIAIIVNGSPFVLLAPTTIHDLLTSPEDYYHRPGFSTYVRAIRSIAWLLSVAGPGLFIALTSYHPQAIPTDLLITLESARASVPFPPLVEVGLMLFAMEIIREGAIRIPGQIGATIGIVGALIMGQAAVQAGIVAPLAVIVVAATTLANYAVVNVELQQVLRFVQWGILLASGVFGLLGFVISGLVTLTHLAGLTSMGMPYLAGLVPPVSWRSRTPIIVRPVWERKERIRIRGPQELVKQSQYSAYAEYRHAGGDRPPV